jgi:hypothetical protein
LLDHFGELLKHPEVTYHRRARLEARIGEALEEVDRRIRELLADRR